MDFSAVCRKIAGILNSKSEQKDQEEIIAFGLEIIFSELSKIIILLSVGFLINRVVEVIIITAIFSVYRMISGGVHLDSFTSCLMATLVSITLLAICVRPLAINLPIEKITFFILASYILNTLVVIFLVPVGNKNHEITSPKKVIFFKKSSFALITFVSFVSVFLLFLFKSQLAKAIVLSVVIGMNLQAVTLLPVTYKMIKAFK